MARTTQTDKQLIEIAKKAQDTKVADLAKELGVSASTLRGWIKKGNALLAAQPKAKKAEGAKKSVAGHGGEKGAAILAVFEKNKGKGGQSLQEVADIVGCSPGRVYETIKSADVPRLERGKYGYAK